MKSEINKENLKLGKHVITLGFLIGLPSCGVRGYVENAWIGVIEALAPPLMIIGVVLVVLGFAIIFSDDR